MGGFIEGVPHPRVLPRGLLLGWGDLGEVYGEVLDCQVPLAGY